MKTRTRTALGIDIGGRRISAALVEKTDRGVQILAAGTGDLPAGEPEPQLQPGKVLSRLLRTLGRRATARGVPTAVTVSTDPVIMQLLDLPRQMPTNISEFVEGELKKYVGLSGRRMSSDFCGVGGGGGPVKRLLAVAADAGEIAAALGICRAAGVTVESVEPAALAYARTFRTGQENMRRSGHALVAMLSHRSLVVFVFCEGVLDFVRVREKPADTDASAALTAWLTDELNAVLAYYRMDVQSESPAWRVGVVVHDSAHRKADVEHLPGLEPGVESLTVVESCQPIATLSEPGDASGAAPPPVAVGAALRLLDTSQDDLRIDLTPREVTEAKSYERHLLIAANAAALVIVGLFLVVQLLVRTTGAMDRRLEQARLDGQLYTASARVMQDRYVDEEIARIQGQLAGLQAVQMGPSSDWPAILRSVERATPAGTCITQLAYGETRTIVLQGTSPSREQVESLRRNLDGEGTLGRAWVMGIQRRQDDDRVLEFEIHCIPEAAD